jgi:predicted ArsR family transcriptional regulator
MLQIDLAARVLAYCSEGGLSVLEVVSKMSGGHDRTVALIKELRARGLLAEEIARNQSVGRPRHCLSVTPIGRRFVREYNHLSDLCLRSNENDIKKALHHAELARRLIESGISPYVRFQEVCQLARNIASTAEIKQGPR